MAYLFYTTVFLCLLAATALYLTRSLWKSHAPPIPYLTAPGPIPTFLYDLPQKLNPFARNPYIRLPGGGSFQEDMEAGFSSSNFDLQGNVEDGDSRRGLDDRAKEEVRRIMKDKRVGFDEARRIWMEERFGREGIARDGRPRDPKAVMFDRL